MKLKYYSGAQVTSIIEKLPSKEYLEMLNAFAKEPSADVVKVVRCKECRFFDNTTDFTYCKRVAWIGMDEDDYCSFAKWKDDASHPFADDVMMGEKDDAEIH